MKRTPSAEGYPDQRLGLCYSALAQEGADEPSRGAAAWPLAVCAQQGDRMRGIAGGQLPAPADDPESTGRTGQDRRSNMSKFAMLLSLAPLILGSQPIVALANEVPTFDMRVTCRAESQGDPVAGPADACLAEEQKARATLVSQWTQFAPESRTGYSKLCGTTHLPPDR
jgi:hypothetical protein